MRSADSRNLSVSGVLAGDHQGLEQWVSVASPAASAGGRGWFSRLAAGFISAWRGLVCLLTARRSGKLSLVGCFIGAE